MAQYGWKRVKNREFKRGFAPLFDTLTLDQSNGDREDRVKILHFADLHLGVESYGRIDPATGISSRLLDFLSATV